MRTMKEIGKEMTFTNEKGEVDYRVEMPEGDYLFVSASAEYSTTAVKFDHSNILKTKKEILSFRAYWPNGSKRWYEKPGTSFIMAIPKENIYMVEERGYSYVPVEIGGVRYTLNVSGGTHKGWTDYISQGSSIGVFKSKRKLEKLAESTVVPEDVDLGPVRIMSEGEIASYNSLCAYHDTKGKLKEGDKIVLSSGYQVNGSKGPFLIIRRPSRKRHFICSGYDNFKAYYKHIDWTKTAEVNGVALAS